MRRLLLALPVLALVLGLAGCRFTSDNGSSVDCPSVPTATVTAVATGTCTWTASPLPTTSVAPTTTTTTVPPTTTSSAPPAGAFPTPATTGAPNNTAFQPVHTGNMTITQPGTYNGLHVAGQLTVNAADVHIANSWIEGINANEALDNENTALGSARMTVTDTTIGNPAVCNPQPGLGEHDYTATRVRIIGMGDGFRVSGSNVTIQDSFVQTCDDPLNHDDGVQTYCPAEFLPQPCHDVIVNHNTLSVANTRNFTAPVFGGSDPGGSNGQLANSKFTNNLLWGGVFSIYTKGTGLAITGNRVATNRWTMPDGSGCEPNTTGVMTAQGCAYAGWVWAASDAAMANSTCAAQNTVWSDNRAVTIGTNTWQPTNAGTALNCA